MNATYIFYNSTRLITSAGLAALVTAILILLMQSLITMEPTEITLTDYKPVDVVMEKQRKIEVEKPYSPKRPVDPLRSPEMPKIQQSFAKDSNLDIVILAPPPANVPSIAGPSSGVAIAIFKVAPPYPNRAVTRGIGGYVDLMFDITPAGKTENIRIINAQPSGYFEKASVNTLAKWKYKPAMDDGEPKPQKNQTTRIVFELEK